VIIFVNTIKKVKNERKWNLFSLLQITIKYQ